MVLTAVKCVGIPCEGGGAGGHTGVVQVPVAALVRVRAHAPPLSLIAGSIAGWGRSKVLLEVCTMLFNLQTQCVSGSEATPVEGSAH